MFKANEVFLHTRVALNYTIHFECQNFTWVQKSLEHVHKRKRYHHLWHTKEVLPHRFLKGGQVFWNKYHWCFSSLFYTFFRHRLWQARGRAQGHVDLCSNPVLLFAPDEMQINIFLPLYSESLSQKIKVNYYSGHQIWIMAKKICENIWQFPGKYVMWILIFLCF